MCFPIWLQFSNKEYPSKMAVEILSLFNRGYIMNMNMNMNMR